MPLPNKRILLIALALLIIVGNCFALHSSLTVSKSPYFFSKTEIGIAKENSYIIPNEEIEKDWLFGETQRISFLVKEVGPRSATVEVRKQSRIGNSTPKTSTYTLKLEEGKKKGIVYYGDSGESRKKTAKEVVRVKLNSTRTYFSVNSANISIEYDKQPACKITGIEPKDGSHVRIIFDRKCIPAPHIYLFSTGGQTRSVSIHAVNNRATPSYRNGRYVQMFLERPGNRERLRAYQEIEEKTQGYNEETSKLNSELYAIDRRLREIGLLRDTDRSAEIVYTILFQPDYIERKWCDWWKGDGRRVVVVPMELYESPQDSTSMSTLALARTFPGYNSIDVPKVMQKWGLVEEAGKAPVRHEHDTPLPYMRTKRFSGEELEVLRNNVAESIIALNDLLSAGAD